MCKAKTKRVTTFFGARPKPRLSAVPRPSPRSRPRPNARPSAKPSARPSARPTPSPSPSSSLRPGATPTLHDQQAGLGLALTNQKRRFSFSFVIQRPPKLRVPKFDFIKTLKFSKIVEGGQSNNHSVNFLQLFTNIYLDNLVYCCCI